MRMTLARFAGAARGALERQEPHRTGEVCARPGRKGAGYAAKFNL